MSRVIKSGHPLGYVINREIGDKRQAVCCNINAIEYQFQKSEGLFYRKSLMAHYGCINALEFSNNGSLLASGGDDRRILVWNVHKAIVGPEKPKTMDAEHLSNVFALTFDCSNTKIISAGNDDQVIVHDIKTGVPLDYFVQEQPVFGVCSDPLNDNIFASACDDGRILIYDIRDSSNEPFCLAKLHSAFHSVMFNPVEPRLLVSANAKEGAGLWDIRMPKKVLLKYGRQTGEQCCMNVRFNKTGSQVLALRRRLPPILYATHSCAHLFQFNHSSYYNSCTMKSCSFGGPNDDYVMSGSDNFDIHVWKIPSQGNNQWVNEAQLVLKGHRSIVNQVRYNYTYDVIASSGVEKMIKLWSPFNLPDESCWKNDESGLTFEPPRKIYSHEEYIRLVLRSGGSGQGQFASMSQEVGRRNTLEDSRMMAFFDALVQRDIYGLSEADSGEDSTYTNTVYSTQNSSSDHSDDDINTVVASNEILSRNVSSQNAAPNSIVDFFAEEAVVEMDDLPIINSQSEDSDPELLNSVPSSRGGDTSSVRRLLIVDVDVHGIVDNDNIMTNSELTCHGTKEPNTLTKLIAKRESQLQRLAISTLKPPYKRKKSKASSSKKSSESKPAEDNPSSSLSEESGEDRTKPNYVINPHNQKQGNSSRSKRSSRKKHKAQPYSSSDLRSPVRFRERRKSLQTTPVYESSNNSHVTSPEQPGPSYQLISDLMNRTPLSDGQLLTTSSSNHPTTSTSARSNNNSSSSSLSSSSSSSDRVENKQKYSFPASALNDLAYFKSKVCTVTRYVTSSASSTSDEDSPSVKQVNGRKHFTSQKPERHKMSSSEESTSDDTSSSDSCKSKSSPESHLSYDMRKNKKRKESRVFKKSKAKSTQRKSMTMTKHKGKGTPSDSGIEMSKNVDDQEPCCSKSCSSTRERNLSESDDDTNEIDNKTLEDNSQI